ncbi:MAG: YlxR family protein [Anaerolineae bacterium]|nr:YlxR family protein [Anaerolineae bacterium]MBT4312043.1 YlxR family protein [Anaerolineae bacterium]MBT4459499.1 YlxR family protein [Anaerolineae bacterium]MBT4842107.1 YlxR family protein [Anaerolineae bacterium]MBT6062257.1 YlxR family protein [Anaerolineae bacterium]
MSKKSRRKKRHVPQRTCVGCRETLAKQTLTRIVRSPDGVQVDLTGKLSGRGAYLHDQRECWEKALKGALANALKTKLTVEERTTLEEYSKNVESKT